MTDLNTAGVTASSRLQVSLLVARITEPMRRMNQLCRWTGHLFVQYYGERLGRHRRFLVCVIATRRELARYSVRIERIAYSKSRPRAWHSEGEDR